MIEIVAYSVASKKDILTRKFWMYFISRMVSH